MFFIGHVVVIVRDEHGEKFFVIFFVNESVCDESLKRPPECCKTGNCAGNYWSEKEVLSGFERKFFNKKIGIIY